MAERLGAVRPRIAIGVIALALVLLAAYWLVLRQETAEPRVRVPQLAAAIGEGEEAIGVSGDGSLVRWLPLPEDPRLPRLPLDGPPKGGRVKGRVLEQVRVLAAAPEALRPYLESSAYGETGVEVTLASGIELRFGDSSQTKRKWRAAAAVLANPEVTAVDYVNLQDPRRPSYGGSEHELPPVP